MRIRARWAWTVALGMLGAAMAAPFPVLEIAPGGVTLALAPDAAFVYAYRQSIYGVPVEERFRVEGDALRMLQVRSTNAAAVEYFRWPGTVTSDGAWLSLDAPDITVDALDIRVARGAEQRVNSGTGQSVRLDHGGAEVVRVAPARRPGVLWLMALIGHRA